MTGWVGPVAGLVEEEGRHVGGEDGRVDHQEQDNPVPQSLNRRGWVSYASALLMVN